MGIAEVIPGVSGSTIALILGIYDDFINLLHSVSDIVKTVILFIIRKKSFKDVISSIKAVDIKFGIFLGIGMVISIAGFSHIFTFLLDKYPMYVYAFFFGLVISSVLFPFERMKSKGLKELVIFIVSFLVFFIILGIKPVSLTQDPPLLYVFFGGAIAICAMVLPGISGSFILLLLGLYNYIIETVKHLTKFDIEFSQIIMLVTLTLGIGTGFIIFVRILKVALSKFPSELMAFLIALMFASLRVIWPFIDTDSAQKVESMKKVMPGDLELSQNIIIISIILITASITVAVNTWTKHNRKTSESL